MTDTKIKAQGAKGDDAIAPQVQINATTNEWEISTDGGKNWKSTGIKATGEKGDRGDAADGCRHDAADSRVQPHQGRAERSDHLCGI